jgi:hypothetical protein
MSTDNWVRVECKAKLVCSLYSGVTISSLQFIIIGSENDAPRLDP